MHEFQKYYDMWKKIGSKTLYGSISINRKGRSIQMENKLMTATGWGWNQKQTGKCLMVTEINVWCW
jgi:hypothetical protein